MKKLAISSLTALTIACQAHPSVQGQDFKSEQYVSKSEITLHGNIDKVFPLFGAFEEKKWADDWNPTPVFPASEKMEEGFIFKSPGHIHGELSLTWVVLKYDEINHQVHYLTISQNRLTDLIIQCTTSGENETKASITYTITGLDTDGNEIAHHIAGKFSASGLKDWEKAINEYLSKK